MEQLHYKISSIGAFNNLEWMEYYPKLIVESKTKLWFAQIMDRSFWKQIRGLLFATDPSDNARMLFKKNGERR